jgi:hypothetical protein
MHIYIFYKIWSDVIFHVFTAIFNYFIVLFWVDTVAVDVCSDVSENIYYCFHLQVTEYGSGDAEVAGKKQTWTERLIDWMTDSALVVK